jgi:CubicO group peptidase (beta-lactamase class C family)
LLGCTRPTTPGNVTRAPASSAAPRVAAAVEADFNRYITDDQIRAIIVTVDGRTLFERYYGGATAEDSRSVFSVTKSVISVLVGQAVSEGRLRLEDRLSRLLPQYAKEMTPRVAGVTLRQLLTMTGGFQDTSGGIADAEMARSKDWVRFILAHQDGEPGKEFVYSDFGAHLLSPILQHATGQPVLAYARTHLFDPLGIRSRPAAQPVAFGPEVSEFNRARFAWATDPQGFALGFTHLKMPPRDMARFGQLFLQEGRWDGRQLVPATWVRQSTTAQAGDAFSPYGFLWWITEADHARAFAAEGYGGQLVEGVPQRRLVVVISTYVDLNTYKSSVGPDDVRRLAERIVRAAGVPGTPSGHGTTGAPT